MIPSFKTILAGSACIMLGLALTMPGASLAQTAARRSDAAQPAKPPFPELHFNASSNGENAIGNLGSNLPAVAAFYGKTASVLREQLLGDRSAWIDKGGRLFYIESGLTSSGSDLAVTGALYPLDQTFLLHSRPSSKRKIYLDFNGHTTTGTAWNSSYGVDPIISPAFDLDGAPGTFNTTELNMIQNMWRRVAEDYASFDVDVTTEEPSADQLSRSSLADDTYGTRALITKNFTAGTAKGDCGCGGFAYVGIFDYTSDAYKPAFIFQDKLGNGEKPIAEAVAHEVGHNLGLSHDGTPGTGYYQGHGTGATGWAPIMGVGYYKELVQFSKGEYANANNKEDDFLVMQNNGVMFAADDFGNSMASATALNGTAANGYNSFDVNGAVESPADVDFFKFPSAAGSVTISAQPFQLSPNLDILLQLSDANGILIAESNPPDLLNGSIGVSVPAAGTYYLSIQGTGKGDPLTTGYTDYGSIGRYAINVSAPLAGSFPTAVINATPTSGPAPLAVNFSSTGSSDPGGSPLSYAWNFGDGSPGASGAAANHTYAAGSYSASLTVTNSSGFSDIKSQAISATSAALPKIYAVNIAMSLASNNARQTYALAKVTVKDAAGNLISGASVSGTWSGLVGNSNTAVTDGSGVATSKSQPSKKSGTFKYTITGITATGYVYDASLNTMTSNSITK